MFLRIEQTADKILVGKSLEMSLQADRTFELWKSFMPHLKSLKHRVGGKLYSLQIYESAFDFNTLELDKPFTKWAAVEVEQQIDLPQSFSSYLLKGGKYAVFLHTGTPANFYQTLTFIYNVWFPESGYQLDNREHFELLDSRYINNDPRSQEEVWIPVK